jgi:hypothetical protein
VRGTLRDKPVLIGKTLMGSSTYFALRRENHFLFTVTFCKNMRKKRIQNTYFSRLSAVST